MFGKKAILAVVGLGAAAVAVACGSMDGASYGKLADTSPQADAQPDQSANPSGSGGAGSDPSVSGIIAIHASRNLPAFRLCFPDRSNILPLPDDKLMPNANVVGVDIGAAVHIGSFATTLQGSSAAVGIDGGAYDAGSTAPEDGGDGGAGDAGVKTVDASAPSGDVVHVIEEKLARQFYPQGTDASAWPNCGPLVTVLKQNGYEGHGLYTVQSVDALGASSLTSGAPGVNLIVIEGCIPDPTLDAKACGDTFSAALGNLRYRIVPALTTYPAASVKPGKFPVQAMLLSPRVKSSVDAMQTVTFTFGRLADNTGAPLELDSTHPVPTMPKELDFMAADAGDYDSFGFALHYAGDAGLSQSLATIQSQSSPRDLPQSFYLLPSNFVILIVGDPTAPPSAAGPGASLHFLAVPVRDPDTLVDAGGDGG